MKRILKRFLIFISLAFLSIVFLSVILSLIFTEEIEKIVVKNIETKITTEISLGDVSFKLYKHFPFTSVEVSDLKIMESEIFEGDTLVYAKKAFIKFSLLDLISTQLDINRIILENGKLNIKYNEDNQANFKVFEKNNKAKHLHLEEVFLSDIAIKYYHHGTQADISFTSRDINLNILNHHIKNSDSNIVASRIAKTSIKIVGSFYSDYLIVLNKDYLTQKELQINTVMEISNDSIIFRSSDLYIENLLFQVTGNISKVNHINLKILGKKHSFKSIMYHTPKHLQNIYSEFSADGVFTFNANVKGFVSQKKNPSFTMDFEMKNGEYSLKNYPFFLHKISLKGDLRNGKGRNFEDTEIQISEFNGLTNKGDITAQFNITNLNKYYLQGVFDWTWNLEEVSSYFKESPFSELRGILKATTKYNGNFSFDKKFKNYFLNSSHQSNAKFIDVSFNYKDSPLRFNIKNMLCSFDNNMIDISSSQATINDSDFDFQGKIKNFIGYLLDSEKLFEVNGDLNSIYTKFDEVVTIKDINNNKTSGEYTFPHWIRFSLKTRIENLGISNFITSNINGDLQYIPGKLEIRDMKLNSLNGNVLIDNLKFYETNWNYIKLDGKIEVEGINIRNGFSAFNNFGQDFIQDRHLKGLADAHIELSSGWKSGFVFDEAALKLKSHMIIKKGELNKFKPLKSLSSFINVDDLKNVQFSTLENTIEIENRKITIPAMEIKSSALSVYLEGTHTFDHKINYQIKLLLSEILSSKFRKKNTNINEYGEMKKNAEGFSAVYLTMTGNTDDPKINFNKIAINEKVSEEIKKEKDLIKTIIEEDILQNKNQEIKKDPEIILDWEDERNK